MKNYNSQKFPSHIKDVMEGKHFHIIGCYRHDEAHRRLNTKLNGQFAERRLLNPISHRSEHVLSRFGGAS